jgi:alpha-L-arabinofuranosidase
LINRNVNNSVSVKFNPGFKSFKIESTVVLSSNSYKDENTPEKPSKVVPVTKADDKTIHAETATIVAPKHSLTVIKITKM